MKNDGETKLLLVGAGKMGMNHLRNALKILRNDSIFVFDTDEVALERCSQKGVTVLRHPGEIANVPGLTHAIIATPTSTHFEWIQILASKVKEILVEKPIVSDLEQSTQLLEVMQSQKSNVVGGFIERFNPAICELQNQVKLSQNVFSANFTRTNRVSERVLDVDVVTDLMVHDLDLALLFFGPVTKTFATGKIREGLVDHATATLIHEGGCTSCITASRLVHKKIRKIEVNSLDGRLECDLLAKDLLIIRDHQEQEIPGRPYRLISSHELVEVKSSEALHVELQMFFNQTHGSEQPLAAHNLDDMARLADLVERIRSDIYGVHN